jgi:predicted ferric reductase
MPNKLTYRTGWIYIVLIVAVPVVTWLQINGFGNFSDGYGFFYSFGRIFGLMALCLYAINFMLSTRLRMFDDLFGGMNRAYMAHHTVGGLAFVAMLMHPLLLATGYMAGGLTKQAAALLLPTFGAFVNWPVNFGIFALTATSTLLFITFYTKLKHEKWLKTHQLLGLAFSLVGLHVYLIPSDVAHHIFLRVYMLSLVSLGLIAYTYRTVFGEQLVQRKHLVVTEVARVAKKSIRITLRPREPRDALRFAPGQFVFVRFRQTGLPYEFHPFSITVRAGSPEVSLIVKASGDYTSQLWKLQPGAAAEIEGAFGRFYAQVPAGQPQIWIAGGIGITPFLSMAKSLTPQANVELFYVADDGSDIVEYNEIMQVVGQLQGHLRFTLHYSSQQGRISAATIQQQSPGGLAGKHVLLCGPPPMMNSLRQQLMQAGVAKQCIHTEEFTLAS